MERKQILTNDNIKTDIKNIIKRPAQLSRGEYWKSRKGVLIFDILLILVMIILRVRYESEFLAFRANYKLVFLVFFVHIIASIVIEYLRLKNRMKKVSIDDYEIKKEAVSHIKHETYINRIGRRSRRVSVYIMHFENGKTWNMSKSNYKWSGECPMSDIMIYQTTHRGDLFWTVTKKDTGKIVMAYPTEYFEYKD